MRSRHLGKLWPVSALTLGGGGIGQLWGETTREESIAVVHAAVDRGIDLLDMAPAYGQGEAELVIGEAFKGRLPSGVRVTTKCRLGTPDPDRVESILSKSLTDSLQRMQLRYVDVFFLHSNIIPDDYDASAYSDRPATRWTRYLEQFRPACEKLIEQGQIGAWGITGIGIPEQIISALAQEHRPQVIQCIANPLNSVGELQYYPGPTRARDIISKAKTKHLGIMGIRAVQGGALTDEVDRPLPDDHGISSDYRRAAAFRVLAKKMNVSAANLAHRYALSMEGIDTVVLGVKNRAELVDCLNAETAGPLDLETMGQIDAVF